MGELVLLLLFAAFLWFLVLKSDGNSKEDSKTESNDRFADGYLQGMRDAMMRMDRNDDEPIDVKPIVKRKKGK